MLTIICCTPLVFGTQKKPEISVPYDQVNFMPVYFNSSTRDVTSMPKEWQQLLQEKNMVGQGSGAHIAGAGASGGPLSGTFQATRPALAPPVSPKHAIAADATCTPQHSHQPQAQVVSPPFDRYIFPPQARSDPSHSQMVKEREIDEHLPHVVAPELWPRMGDITSPLEFQQRALTSSTAPTISNKAAQQHIAPQGGAGS